MSHRSVPALARMLVLPKGSPRQGRIPRCCHGRSPFCATETIDADAIQNALVETISGTPELGDAPAALSIMTAFSRYWPCVSPGEVEQIQSGAMVPVDFDALDALVASGGHALDLGNPEAAPNRTLIVFHDQNCPHCRRFRSEVETLLVRGWRVMIYPVAVVSEESAGYGAVEIAMRDLSQAAGIALYAEDPGSTADITIAMKIAERAGVPTKDILTAIASTGAYDAVQNNTRTFFELGAKGTPAWILGNSLYSGGLSAGAIEDLADTFEGEEEDGIVDPPIQDEEPADDMSAPHTTEISEPLETEAGEPVTVDEAPGSESSTAGGDEPRASAADASEASPGGGGIEEGSAPPGSAAENVAATSKTESADRAGLAALPRREILDSLPAPTGAPVADAEPETGDDMIWIED